MRHLLLIGAQKAGTTYLHNLLAQDARIAIHPKKEPQYFTKPVFENIDYYSMFDVQKDKAVILDSSASYLHIQGTAERIKSRLGVETTIAVAIREPIHRAVSAYLHNVKHGRELRSDKEASNLESQTADEIFDEETALIQAAERRGMIAIERSVDKAYYDPLFSFRYISNSLYHRQVQPFALLFPDIVIVEFEAFKQQPAQTANRIRASVGLTDPVEFQLEVSRNRTKLSRWTALRGASRHNPTSMLKAASRLSTQDYDAYRIRKSFTDNLLEITAKDFAAILANRPLAGA